MYISAEKRMVCIKLIQMNNANGGQLAVMREKSLEYKISAPNELVTVQAYTWISLANVKLPNVNMYISK